jgi:acyl carrier protein
MSPPRERFAEETVAWLNRRFAAPGFAFDADTELFRDRLIDSIRILDLLAWTETRTGRRIPDEMLRMDHFRSVRTIAETFCRESDHDHR